MKMLRVSLISACLVFVYACVDPDDLVLDEQQQPETIEVNGCNPGFFSLGDGENMVCIADPRGGGGDTLGNGEPRGPGGPGGPGGTPNAPSPIPERKDCSGLEHAECKDCCYFNYDRVDGERCRKRQTSMARFLC